MMPLSSIAPGAAEARAQELRHAISVLLPDSDDPMVLSELCALMSALRRVEQQMGVRP